RHAHIILPPTASLERGHYDLAFHLLAVRNTAKFSQPLFQPGPDARHDWEVFLELQTRIEHQGLLGGVKRALTRRFFGPERILDLGLRFGPYGAFGKWHGRPARENARRMRVPHLTLRKLKAAPHGIDLGPLTLCLPQRLRTADKQIDLAPEVLVQDVERVKTKFFGVELNGATHQSNGHLLLIGRRQLRSNNSWMHNSERL